MADIRDRDIRARAGYDPRYDRVRPSAQKAQAAARSQETSGGNTESNTNSEKEEPSVFRYPLEKLDKTADCLFIQIYDQLRSSDIFGLKQTISGNQKIDLAKVGGIKNYDDYFNTTQGQNKLKKTNVKYIYLPIPQQISDALSVSYGEDTLNPVQATGLKIAGGIVEKGGEAIKTQAEIVKQIAFGNIQGIDEGTKKAVQALFSATAVNSLGANVSPDSLLSRASGQILQSNLELLFSGVTLRAFPFQFDFAPRNPDESREVMDIIRVLKKSMVPKKGNALFIGAPKVFQLEYLSGQKQHPFLNKFKICSLTDLSINYNASGTYSTYEDGTPVHIQIQCTFKEINPVYSEDYDTSYGKGGVGY